MIKIIPIIELAGEQSDAISREINLVVKNIVGRMEDDLELDETLQASLKKRLLGVTPRTYLWLKLITEVIYK
jgi:hypothetical protein